MGGSVSLERWMWVGGAGRLTSSGAAMAWVRSNGEDGDFSLFSDWEICLGSAGQ